MTVLQTLITTLREPRKRFVFHVQRAASQKLSAVRLLRIVNVSTDYISAHHPSDSCLFLAHFYT